MFSPLRIPETPVSLPTPLTVALVCAIIGCTSCGLFEDNPVAPDSPPDTPRTAIITPLSNGDVLVETNNGSARASWIGPTGSDRLIDEVHSVTVSFENGDPDVHVGVEGDVVTSVIQEDGWGISFDRSADGGYIGRFTSPDGANETFSLPDVGNNAAGSTDRASLQQQVGHPVFYVETVCQGRRSYTNRTAVTTRIVLAENNRQLYFATILEGVDPGRGFYEFAVPSNLPEQAREAYLQDIRNDCEDFVVPFNKIKWELIDLACALKAGKPPTFMAFCLAISTAGISGLKELLTTRTSEGGLIIDCILLDLFLRAIPFDADIEVTAYAWDPELGDTELVHRSYDGFAKLFNTSISVPYSDTSRCSIEQWSLLGRCVGQTRVAFTIEFSLQRNAEQSVSGTGNGIDYDQSYLTVKLDARFIPGSKQLYGDLSTADSDGGTRQDRFTTSLVSDDTGYFGITTVVGGACPGEIRIVKDGSTSAASLNSPPTGGSGEGSVLSFISQRARSPARGLEDGWQ
ncbi:MAG TPA: hypothetical protein VEW03_04430 [Longimicrobiaceae bacterium]|nr:hypothetical protein [Longimicrobiaceae bacterium]